MTIFICEGKTFETLEEAKVWANRIFKKTGAIVAIERVQTKTESLSPPHYVSLENQDGAQTLRLPFQIRVF